MQVWARDPNLIPRGILPAYSAQAVLRENDVGTWVMSLQGDHPITDLLGEGWGVIVYDDDQIMFSGPINLIRSTPDGSALDIEIAGVTDTAHAEDRLVHPDPALPADQQTTAYWSRTGSSYYARDLIAAIVNRNMGLEALAERQVSGILHCAYGVGNGSTSTINARFSVLLDEVRTLARAGGYVFDIIQEGHGLRPRIRETTDRHLGVRFMPRNGLTDYELTLNAPTATVVYVAGQGEGAARTIAIHEATETWGRRIETFQDRRDTDALDELEKAGKETLAENAGTATAVFTVEETPTLRFGHDYDLGDTVTVSVRNAQVIQYVRAADITWNEYGRVVKLTVGDYSAPEPNDPAWGRRVREALRAIRHLEENQ